MIIGDKLAKLSQRERVGLVLAGACVLLTIAYGVVFRPVRGRFDQVSRDIRTATQKLAQNDRELDQRRQDAIRTAYAKYIPLLEKASTPEEESAEMVREIENVARLAGVNLNGTTPREPVALSVKGTTSQEPGAKNIFRECRVEVDVDGSMSSLIAFLYGLQESPLLLRVQRLTLAPQSKEKTALVKGTLSITRITVL